MQWISFVGDDYRNVNELEAILRLHFSLRNLQEFKLQYSERVVQIKRVKSYFFIERKPDA